MRFPGEISREEYEAHPGVRWSLLSHMRKSPMHYQHALTAQSRTSTALRTGSALHTLVFEPETFEERFTVYRESKSTGKGARKNWDAFQAECKGRGVTILDPAEELRVSGCAAAISRTPASKYIAPSRGRAEIPLTWTDPTTGLVCKCRIDWLTLDMMPIDLKSTRSAETRNFGRQAWHYGYFHQAAFYSMGLSAATGKDVEHIPFLFIAVESEPPHDVSVFEPCDETKYAALEEVRGLLEQLAECKKADKWPGRYEDIQILKAPAYVLMSEDEDWNIITTQEAA